MTSGGCDDGESRNQATCESLGRFWYSTVCRGIFTWDASYGFVGSGTGQYAECAKCHNDRHYPKNKPGTHYHGTERSVAETYVMTGHKNMVRPAAPVGNTDPHYIAGAPWKDKTGAVDQRRLLRQPDRLAHRPDHRRRRPEAAVLDLRLDLRRAALRL